jgi:hypothetical protein
VGAVALGRPREDLVAREVARKIPDLKVIVREIEHSNSTQGGPL